MFKVEVIADSSGKWVGNGLTFETLDDAKDYGGNLFMRWTSVRDWHVIDAEGNEAFRFDGQAG